MILLHLLFILAGLPAGFLASRLACRWPVEPNEGSGRQHGPWFTTGCGVAGLLIALSAYAYAPSGTFVLSCLFGWTLLSLAAIDLKHFILPDILNLTAACLGLSMIWLTQPDAWAEHLIGGVAGFGLLFTVETGYRCWRKAEGLGRGDAKLLGVLGLWVGWTRLPDILLIASATGLIAVLGASLISKTGMNRTTAIAFGPWLALAGWIAWLSGPVLVPAI